MRDRLIDLQAKWANELGLGENPTARFGAPVSFTSHLASIAPGATQVLGTSGLANGYRTPYVIDEIRMQAYVTTLSLDAAPIQPSYALQLQFRTGAYAFSQVPIPLVLHGPKYMRSPVLGSAAGIEERGPMLISEFATAGGSVQLGDESRWVLAKPLWMAPGDQIQCSVLRHVTAASAGSVPFAVDVTYVGRSLKPGTPGPKARFVPWIAHYVHDFADSFSQTTTQFRNPFQQSLNVHKLVGHQMSKATSGDFPTSGDYGTLPAASNAQQYASIYMTDSLGYRVTNQFTPVGNVFHSERCEWAFSRPLGPRDQFNMQFRTEGTTALTNVIYGVAMLGYREERG